MGETIIITRPGDFFDRQFTTVPCPMGSEHLDGVWVTSPHLGTTVRVPEGTFKIKRQVDDVDASLYEQREDNLKWLFT